MATEMKMGERLNEIHAQIISAGFQAVLMHGGPALMSLTPLLKAADEFAK